MNQTFNLHSYDKYIVSFSGGKDSTACFLYLLDNGVPLQKNETNFIGLTGYLHIQSCRHDYHPTRNPDDLRQLQTH